MTRFVVIASDDRWILIQRGSKNGTVSFDQDWAAYRDGFGSPHGDDNYWRGLRTIRCLCGEQRCRLKVEVDKTFKYEVFALILSVNLAVNHRPDFGKYGKHFYSNRKRSKLLNIV